MKTMKSMNSDPVQDYILEDENKMQTAAAVFDAWPKVRRRLVLGFLDRLEGALRLKKELAGWEFERWNCPFEDGEAGFDFGKPAWKDEYYVSLYFGHRGQKVCFGLARDEMKERIKKSSPCPKLLAAVKEHYPTAGAYKWWEAWISVESLSEQPLTEDWGKPEVLWRMHDEKDEFLNEVEEQLLKVARLSAPFVDQLARKK
jgi:hypothetical protein